MLSRCPQDARDEASRRRYPSLRETRSRTRDRQSRFSKPKSTLSHHPPCVLAPCRGTQLQIPTVNGRSSHPSPFFLSRSGRTPLRPSQLPFSSFIVRTFSGNVQPFPLSLHPGILVTLWARDPHPRPISLPILFLPRTSFARCIRPFSYTGGYLIPCEWKRGRKE